MVLMILQPPMEVPKAIDMAQASFTHMGTWNSWMSPPLKSDMAMIPIDFCASLPPWLKAIRADEKICALENILVTVAGLVDRKIKFRRFMNMKPTKKPITGEIRSHKRTFVKKTDQ